MAKYIIDIPDEVKWIQYIQQTRPGTQNLIVKYVCDMTPYTEPDINITKDNPVHLCASCKRVRLIEPCPIKKNDILCGEDGEGGKGICCCKAYLPEITNRKAVEDEVWNLAREIAYCMSFEECVDAGMLCDDDIYNDTSGVLEKLTYQEAKAKYDAWKKQMDEIRVGDEVTFYIGPNDEMKAVALDQTGVEGEWSLFTENGCIEEHAEDFIKKTGRHFDEFEELLKKIKGE